MNNILGCTLFLITMVTLVTGLAYGQEGKVRANGMTIAYESFGKETDQAIILIQGTGAPMTDWPTELCQGLADHGFWVIRFDNRDIGRSSHLTALGQPDWAAIGALVGSCETDALPYTLQDMSKDVIGLLDALEIEKAHMVGASMGGAIAQLVAIHYPKRTWTLTSISATSGNPTLPWGDAKALQAMGAPPPSTTNRDSLVNHLVNIYKALGSMDDDQTMKEQASEHLNRSWYPEGSARQAAAVLLADRCDRREQLGQLDLPVAVVHGDSDPLVPLMAGRDVAQSVPNAEMCVIEGMGHHISRVFLDALENCIMENVQKTEP